MHARACMRTVAAQSEVRPCDTGVHKRRATVQTHAQCPSSTCRPGRRVETCHRFCFCCHRRLHRGGHRGHGAATANAGAAGHCVRRSIRTGEGAGGHHLARVRAPRCCDRRATVAVAAGGTALEPCRDTAHTVRRARAAWCESCWQRACCCHGAARPQRAAVDASSARVARVWVSTVVKLLINSRKNPTLRSHRCRFER